MRPTNKQQRPFLQQQLKAGITDHKRRHLPVSNVLNIFSSSLLLARRFVDQTLVNVRNDTTTCNGSLDESIQLFVTTNGELQVARRDALDFQIFAGISSQLEHFGSQVFKNGRSVNGSGSTDTVTLVNRVLEETMHTTHGKLQAGFGGARLRGLFRGGGFATLSSFAAFASFSALHCS